MREVGDGEPETESTVAMEFTSGQGGAGQRHRTEKERPTAGHGDDRPRRGVRGGAGERENGWRAVSHDTASRTHAAGRRTADA
ncbi:hypothetical protein GCM10009760_61350 [Kitasatospora kazusensis]|uniref:Uncharacterized protein n=1 Tax=Kitasatospora kazusensis TaxID=407974 RepID=A0ABP5M0S9_9ACTN